MEKVPPGNEQVLLGPAGVSMRAGLCRVDTQNASAEEPAGGLPKWWSGLWTVPGNAGKFLGWPAVSFIALQLLVGFPLLPYAFVHWHSDDMLRFACFLAVALGASLFKVRLPGIPATMSANFLFILVGILDLSYPETLLMGCLGGLAQMLWHAKPLPRPIQLLFTFANLAISVTAASLVFHSEWAARLGLQWPLLLLAASTTYFLMNTMSVSGVIAATDRRNPLLVWKECYLWSFPYYMFGALIAGCVSIMNRTLGWQVAILVLPVVYWMYRSYRMYLDRLEAEKKHSEEIADLHLRTIEALSLAIEAKDHNTHAHLRRVQTYALQIGKDLGLSDAELNAIRAAAMLHDIGKLAVPEQILSKPGRLTPEEFDKMKIHPVVGAEILARVHFPYPVVPIVRSHHEKWDGSGYPDGLKGDLIPAGARILSAVDCFDALTSERPYRRAISADEAMAHLKSESGRSYDPRVVQGLERRYRELEEVVNGSASGKSVFEVVSKVERGVAPSAGFAELPNEAEVRAASFLASIVSARQEAQLLFELAQTLGNSLSLRETLSVVAVRLKQMIPYDSIVFYVCQGDKLVPKYLHGVDFDLFSQLEIPLGQGIAGWVAVTEKPIINGNPAAETQHLGDPRRIPALQSSLSIPLRGRDGVAGVLSLYLREKNGFTKDQLRLLLAASSKLGLSVENALQYEKAQDTASTDYLTGLPNARSICVHMEKEISRARRAGHSLGVLLCDLNGFKRVNDNYGHLTGNKLLQLIAGNLKTACREYDQVGRLGGDEFVFVLPETSAVSAKEFQRRLELAVEEAGIKLCGEKVVTASIGCAFHPDDGETAEDLLSEADRRMYESKEKFYLQRGEGQAPRPWVMDASGPFRANSEATISESAR
ncbi:MAG TPA: HD domain-containing phosphohydrolase [Patescibacteria group bacterium]|nr:HD domain-containing phosphohydrolase [Patescibacteria group bacterium]